jgi:hypothetical protein
MDLAWPAALTSFPVDCDRAQFFDASKVSDPIPINRLASARIAVNCSGCGKGATRVTTPVAMLSSGFELQRNNS